MATLNEIELRVMTMNVGSGKKKGKQPQQQTSSRRTGNTSLDDYRLSTGEVTDVFTNKTDMKARVVQDVQAMESPDILMFQEYFKGQNDTGVSIIYNRKKIRIRCSSLKEIGRTYKHPMLPFLEGLRIDGCEMVMINAPEKPFIVISWHGPFRLTVAEKKQYLGRLIEHLKHLKEHINIPILIGGDFNTKIKDMSDDMQQYKPFMLKDYKVSPRRMKNGVIDYFIYTDDLELRKCKCVDLKEATDVSLPEELFDHDPVIATVVFKHRTSHVNEQEGLPPPNPTKHNKTEAKLDENDGKSKTRKSMEDEGAGGKREVVTIPANIPKGEIELSSRMFTSIEVNPSTPVAEELRKWREDKGDNDEHLERGDSSSATRRLSAQDPQKSDIPDGLSMLDPKWTELYLQALREGKEKQRNVRLMIVGHEGVGKTTLARNLMNKPIQGVETTNGIEVHVKTVLVEVDGTWKESDNASKDAEVGERIARIIEPVNKKVKHAETDNIPKEFSPPELIYSRTNIPKEISPPELIYSRTSYPSSADAITEATTLITENELPQDSEKALDTNIPTQVSIPHEVIKKNLSITGQTMVKQLMMVNEKQHDTNPDMTVSVWDFGGQFIFYATHQIFHSSGAIYLLVLDLSKGFEDMIDDGCPIACSGAKRRTVQDFIKFWMHSIHTFASSKTGEPPVILVGTHRDKIDEQEISKEDHAENYFENVRKLFDKTPLLHHIQPQHFFLDNLGPEKNSFTKLRSRVMATAAEQSSFNKEIPAKWIPLEQALCQIENKPYVTFSEVQEMDSKSDVPIADVEVIRLFLMHHHFQGLLVYFNEEELQDYIILKPQWIIDAFKCIITSWRVFNKKPNLREMWQDFENTAVLKNNLIEEVWQRNDETDFLADKELLLKFLVRLGIMSRGRAYDEDTGKVEELDNFLVPSFLPVQRNESDMGTLLVNATPTQMVIVFKFEHSYIYPTEHSYISPTIYHRITAAAVGKWPVVDNGTQLLYGNIGMYRLDTPHVGIVRLTDRTIELSVHNLCGKSVGCDIADSFRRFITRAIKQELSRFHCGKETQITTTFRCSCSKLGTEEHVTTEILKGNDSLPCPVKLSGHIINGKRSYREWFVDADAFVQIDSQVLQKKLGDREIGRISKAIGLNWQLLGMDLGIPMVELERIQMDHPYSSAVQIRYMLQTWKERAVGEATMQALYDKMKDNPEVSIDWDKIKDVIDTLC